MDKLFSNVAPICITTNNTREFPLLNILANTQTFKLIKIHFMHSILVIFHVYLKRMHIAPGSVTQLAAASSCELKVAGSMPSQSTCLGCRFSPWSGCMRGNQLMYLSYINISVPLSPSLPLSLKSITMSSCKGLEKKKRIHILLLLDRGNCQ